MSCDDPTAGGEPFRHGSFYGNPPTQGVCVNRDAEQGHWGSASVTPICKPFPVHEFIALLEAPGGRAQNHVCSKLPSTSLTAYRHTPSTHERPPARLKKGCIWDMIRSHARYAVRSMRPWRRIGERQPPIEHYTIAWSHSPAIKPLDDINHQDDILHLHLQRRYSVCILQPALF